jgi:hypothetical protein
MPVTPILTALHGLVDNPFNDSRLDDSSRPGRKRPTLRLRVDLRPALPVVG